MSIIKRPQQSADSFIAGAPDAKATTSSQAPHITKTGKPGRPAKTIKPVQISVSLPIELLSDVDRQANALSISRAAFIKQALTRAVVAENS